MTIPFLTASRASFVAAVLCLLIIVCYKRSFVWKLLKNYWMTPASPFNLAVFRIVTFLYIFIRARRINLEYYLGLPVELRVPPPGYEAWFHLIPLDPATAHTARLCLMILALMASAGLLTKISAWTATALSLYVFLIPVMFGKIDHGHHHMVWFMLLLAASPCHHALSVDKLFASLRGRKLKGESAAGSHTQYRLPFCFAWLLFGLIYFFPGFWKVWYTGWYWAFSDNLINRMREMWYLREIAPPLGIDRFPLLIHLGAFGAILFELTAPLMILTPAGRLIFAAAGMTFHLGVRMFMLIDFSVLYCYYFILIDWHGLLERITGRQKSVKIETEQEPRRQPVLIACGCLLIAAHLVCGFRHITSWPFAHYPTFRNYRKLEHNKVVIQAVFPGGRTRDYEIRDLKGLISYSHFGKYERLIYYGNQKIAIGTIGLLMKKFPGLSKAVEFRVIGIDTQLDTRQGRTKETGRKTLFVLEAPETAQK